MGGRVYDPLIGRFLSRDPYIDGVGSSQGANGYAYVWNNPLTRWDPTGYAGVELENIIVTACEQDNNCYSELSEQSQRDLGFAGTPATVITGDDGLETIDVVEKKPPPPSSREIDWAQFLKDWWPGYGLGTCIYESYTGGGCGSGTWIMAGIGTIPVPLGKGVQAARGVTEVAFATTKGAHYANLAANIGAREFQSNLLGNGYKVVRQTVGSNGPVTILSNGTNTYTIYTATSTGGLSAQLTNAAGEILSKIRLAGP